MNKTDKLIKVAVVGPESTGKSTMSPRLAEYFGTVWVPEYARYYCAALTGDCTWQDEINMFHGQVALEESLIPMAKNNLLICDTTFITVKIWSDHMFGGTPQIVLDELARRPYDHYLLLNIDLPWQDDPLRNFPDLREHFMDVWHKELNALGVSYSLISGQGEARFRSAVQAVEALFTP
ncbi:MAG: ATP-binding protein [Mucilaginibacter polytrichastri]|nr:ATP-binding protein [Mucilaginibacter polytrichastri]